MGGSERYVWNLAKAQSSDHEVHIYTTTRNLKYTGTSEIDGITVHRAYTPVVIWNINPLTFILRSLMKSNSDIFHIHSHLYTTSNLAVLAKILKKRQAVLQLHGGVGMPPYDVGFLKYVAKHIYSKSLGSFTVTHSNIIASVSRVDLNKIQKMYAIESDHLRYIPNMVDTELFKPRKNGPPVIPSFLYLGDFEPWKGVGSLIQWLRHMALDGHKELRMKFVGQGSFFKPLQILKDTLQRKGNGISVDVVGPVQHKDVPQVLRESTALVLPSYWEGMPTVVLEAMASGVPVISTRVGDVPYIIRNRETGLLIDRSLPSFQSAVDSVLNDESLISNITREARQVIEKEHTLKNTYSIVGNAYAEIAS